MRWQWVHGTIIDLCIYIYAYTYIYISMYIYIYTYIRIYTTLETVYNFTTIIWSTYILGKASGVTTWYDPSILVTDGPFFGQHVVPRLEKNLWRSWWMMDHHRFSFELLRWYILSSWMKLTNESRESSVSHVLWLMFDFVGMVHNWVC